MHITHGIMHSVYRTHLSYTLTHLIHTRTYLYILHSCTVVLEFPPPIQYVFSPAWYRGMRQSTKVYSTTYSSKNVEKALSSSKRQKHNAGDSRVDTLGEKSNHVKLIKSNRMSARLYCTYNGRQDHLKCPCVICIVQQKSPAMV